VHLLDNKVF